MSNRRKQILEARTEPTLERKAIQMLVEEVSRLSPEEQEKYQLKNGQPLYSLDTKDFLGNDLKKFRERIRKARNAADFRKHQASKQLEFQSKLETEKEKIEREYKEKLEEKEREYQEKLETEKQKMKLEYQKKLGREKENMKRKYQKKLEREKENMKRECQKKLERKKENMKRECQKKLELVQPNSQVGEAENNVRQREMQVQRRENILSEQQCQFYEIVWVQGPEVETTYDNINEDIAAKLENNGEIDGVSNTQAPESLKNNSSETDVGQEILTDSSEEMESDSELNSTANGKNEEMEIDEDLGGWLPDCVKDALPSNSNADDLLQMLLDSFSNTGQANEIVKENFAKDMVSTNDGILYGDMKPDFVNHEGVSYCLFEDKEMYD